MSYRWMPILGEFDVANEIITFEGREMPAPPEMPNSEASAAGIIVCDQAVLDGRVAATVEFEEAEHSGCQLILGRDPKSAGMIVAGISDVTPFMFMIREWVPGQPGQQSANWNWYGATGDRSNLRPRSPYDLSVNVEASTVTLTVNGVEVLAATLPSARSQSLQTGVFCLGRGKVRISNFVVERRNPKAFVVMQFSDQYNDVYKNVIKEVCASFRLDCENAAEMYGPGLIIQDIVDRIKRSQVIIAEITPTNPNVYFEVGYALALEKPIILLAQRTAGDSRLPFDVSPFRVLFYDDSIGGKPKLEAGLRNHLEQILGTAPGS